jgi:stage II sporulation protein D
VARFGVLLAVCTAALVAAASACASSVFVVEGRGWGHGIGMSQWGAYGFARHGWSYPRILRHYFPGTRLERVGEPTVRVLLGAGRARYTVGCAAPMSVVDGRGRRHRLATGSYLLGPRLRLPVGHRRVRVKHAAGRHKRFRIVTVRRALAPPLDFDCPRAPLVINGSAYHGRLVIHRWGGKLASVNVVALEQYLRGVVGGEMPHRWNMAALEAQAVAARSYALATLKPRGAYDLYDDTRSQVYGGLDYETSKTDIAVARTRGRVLTWRGRVATTFFFSTSGGRTAAIRDVWPAARNLPYLRSVADPYENGSPHRRWGPVALTPQQIAARLDVRAPSALSVVRSPSGHVSTVGVAGRRVPAWRFEARFRLKSTWFDVGTLSLTAARPRLVYGAAVVLRGRSAGVGRAELQQQSGAGGWRRVRSLAPGAFALRLRPSATTRYRIASRGVAVAPVVVSVAPRVRTWVAAGGARLGGEIVPAARSRVEVERRTKRGWRIVARPAVDARGRFSSPVQLRAGGYRVSVVPLARFAPATTRLQVSERMLAQR